MGAQAILVSSVYFKPGPVEHRQHAGPCVLSFQKESTTAVGILSEIADAAINHPTAQHLSLIHI